jgi:spore germination cell wall hydrolase CwlJ-like protein
MLKYEKPILYVSAIVAGYAFIYASVMQGAHREIVIQQNANAEFAHTITTQLATIDEKVDKLTEILLVRTSERINVTPNEMECLSKNIFYEAGVEDELGKFAVAQVTLNRVKDGGFGSNFCKVIYAKNRIKGKTTCAFSWTCKRYNEPPSGPLWKESQRVAEQFVRESIRLRPIQDALYYHSTDVDPYWADDSKRIYRVGKHIFYTDALKKSS